MRTDLFVYGTLLDAPTRRRVFGRDLVGVRAWLDGFARVRVAGEVYPGLVRMAGGRVAGLLLRDLDRTAMMRGDRFEGEEYRRAMLRVRLPAGGHAKAAVYLPTAELIITDIPWYWDAGWRRRHAVGYRRAVPVASARRGAACRTCVGSIHV